MNCALNENRIISVKRTDNLTIGDIMNTEISSNSSLSKWFLGMTLFIASGCRRCQPGPIGIHSVMLLTDDRDDGARMALRQQRWCKKEKQDICP